MKSVKTWLDRIPEEDFEESVITFAKDRLGATLEGERVRFAKPLTKQMLAKLFEEVMFWEEEDLYHQNNFYFTKLLKMKKLMVRGTYFKIEYFTGEHRIKTCRVVGVEKERIFYKEMDEGGNTLPEIKDLKWGQESDWQIFNSKANYYENVDGIRTLTKKIYNIERRGLN